MRYYLAKVSLLLTLFAIMGCGNSSEPYVYTGASQGQGKVSVSSDVLLSVTVPGTVSGAQLRGVVTPGATVKTVARTDEPIQNGHYTLPGALCRAYDALGQTMATVVISQEGTVHFDTLPPGSYRFVVTNHDSAVVLEVIATVSPGGPTLIVADTATTAAVLVTLSAGKGNFDLNTYSHALAADLAALIALIESQLANRGDPWITADGKTVVDPTVKSAVEAAVGSLSGKGKAARGEETPEGYGQATPAPVRASAGVASPVMGTPTGAPSNTPPVPLNTEQATTEPSSELSVPESAVDNGGQNQAEGRPAEAMPLLEDNGELPPVTPQPQSGNTTITPLPN